MFAIMENERKRVTTRKQFEYLVSWMEKHPNIALGLRFGENFQGSKEEYKKLWHHLSAKLNSLGPPIRTTTEWQKVWTDFKLKIRKKLFGFNKESKSSGEVPYKLHKLASLEQRVVNFLPLKKTSRQAKKYSTHSNEKEFPLPPMVTLNNKNQNDISEDVPKDKEIASASMSNEITATTSNKSIPPSVSITHSEIKSNETGEKIKTNNFKNNRKNLLKEIVESLKLDLKYTMKMYSLKKEKFKFYKNAVNIREKRKLEELNLKKDILNYKNRKLALEEYKEFSKMNE